MSTANKMKEKDLINLTIELTPKGFTIWTTEPVVKGTRHWVVDASMLFEDGEIRLGNPTVVAKYLFDTKYVGGRFERKIVLIDKRIDEKKKPTKKQ